MGIVAGGAMHALIRHGQRYGVGMRQVSTVHGQGAVIDKRDGVIIGQVSAEIAAAFQALVGGATSHLIR